MEERSLRAFLHLTDTLHFGRAAEASHMSASTLSRLIGRLEEELGVTLFERDNRSVAITPAGVRLREHARDLLHEWEALRSSLTSESGELQGELSIYCSVTASYSFLYELLRDFRARHPSIGITIHTGDPEQAIARVRAGSEDLAIGARPERLPEALAFEPIAISPLVFITARMDTPPEGGSGGQPMQTADWAALPMILPERGLARRRVDEWFRNMGIRPNVAAQVAGNEAIVSMVALGGGLGLVPLIVLENSPLRDRVRTLDSGPRLKPFDVGLFVLNRRLRNRVVEAFWSSLRGRDFRSQS